MIITIGFANYDEIRYRIIALALSYNFRKMNENTVWLKWNQWSNGQFGS